MPKSFLDSRLNKADESGVWDLQILAVVGVARALHEIDVGLPVFVDLGLGKSIGF